VADAAAAIAETSDGHAWWQRGVIYQIYPRSFMDSDGDGVGDLRGIASRLDHVVSVGVDAVWISPFYPSPMVDFGYDVTDHCAVDPLFGTLADFDHLLAEAHARGIRVILDFIPNHTSDRHPWFIESRSSRQSPKRGWYVWRDAGADGGVPTNWGAAFGGSTWEWDASTGQYYLHTFLREQPDLNWRNPEVVEAMLDVLRFWLARGVDGFRVDAVQNVVKDDQFRDNPPNPRWKEGDDPFEKLERVWSGDRPEVHRLIARMREVVEEMRPDGVVIGEIYNTVERMMPYYGEGGRGAHFPYNFQLIRLPWEARTIDAAVRRYEALLPPGAWPNWVLGNHDRPRIATRVGAEQARVAAVLLFTLRGTPTLYYGDEIGMTNVPIPPEREVDPWGRRVPGFGRDPERTPMQWDGGPGAGFTTGDPWLPISPNASTVNVAAEDDDPTSMLNLHRRLIELRRREPALAVGSYAPVDARGDVLAYVREAADGARFLVALNLGASPQVLDVDESIGMGDVVLSTLGDGEGRAVRGRVELAADEAVVVRLRA
jgi:alpha-glucosidase